MIASLTKSVRTVALACSVWFIATVADAEMARCELDPEHTTIGFSAGHMMVSQVQGQFNTILPPTSGAW